MTNEVVGIQSIVLKIWTGFLLFCSIYAFSLPRVGNSSYWSFALILISLLVVNGSFSNVKLLLKQKIFFLPLIILILITFISFLVPVIYLTFDITMLKTWINNIVAYIAMSILASIFLSQNFKSKDVFYIVFSILFVQTLIVWVMLAVPSIRELIQGLTKSMASMQRMEQYGGVRGIGFTSFAAFGFTVIMGLLGLLMNFYFAEYKSKSSLAVKLIVFFLVLIASISAGRSAIAGLFIGLGFYYISLGVKRFSVGIFKVSLYCLVLLIPIVLYIMSQPYLTDIVVKYYHYAFKFIHMYFTDGYVGRTSLATLDTMYFPLTEYQILFGDGKYTGIDGAYYKHTDPGFMRFTLMFGLFPSLLIYLGFLYIMFSYYVLSKEHVKNIGVLILAIIGLSFIYHYKGELIMFNVSYMKIIYFVFISLTLITLKETNQYTSSQTSN